MKTALMTALSPPSLRPRLAGAGRVPLARRNLWANKARLLRSLAGIGFAVLLMLMQLGFERAFFQSSLQVIELLDGDLFIQNAHKYRFVTRQPFPPADLDRARRVQGVASVRPFYADWYSSFWRNPYDGKVFMVRAFAFDPDQPVFLLPAVNAHLAALKAPDAVLVDRRARPFLGMGGTATAAAFNGRPVHIVGRFALGPDFQNDGTVIMSARSFANLLPPGAARGVEAGIIKLKPGADPGVVAAALKRVLPSDIAVFTKAQLYAFERDFEARVSSAGVIFAMGTIVGFVVGALIAYQIVYTDLTDQLPQYATLKAIGYGPSYIVGVVLRQAGLLALGGWVPAFFVSLLLYRWIGNLALIPLGTSLYIVGVSFALTLFMCLLSAALAMIRVVAADPAEVF
ncbi:MAG TPA: ABC transporter permease DevC [Stellaceae bacterium]|nr:ABC transporter permease DevC [Stellaceae bacterium]